eukprot:Opistho-2@34829
MVLNWCQQETRFHRMLSLRRSTSLNSNAGGTAGVRTFFANNVERNTALNFLKNRVTTTKYNILTFLPKNLFQQFTRIANLYFLILLFIQLIPEVTSQSPATTAVPLLLVLSITAVKDGVDDYKRYKSDLTVNKRKTEIMRNGNWEDERWDAIAVGDMVRVENNQPVPADIIVLATNDPECQCFIETCELDGETNLKVRRAIKPTMRMTDPSQFARLEAEFETEEPNMNLHRFVGKVTEFSGDVTPIDNDNLILRGCVMRNSKWIIGIVVFAGHDTKLMMNSSSPRFKRTKVDKAMNVLIASIFGLLIALCVLSAILASVWENSVGVDFVDYLPYYGTYNTG